MSAVRLVLHELRYDQKTFWRNPAATFFAVVLPIMFLIIFVTIFGNEKIELADGRLIKGSTYYVPGIITLGVISTTFTNLAISLVAARERGLLKRVRKTPLPPGRSSQATATAVVTAVRSSSCWSHRTLVYGVSFRPQRSGVVLARSWERSPSRAKGPDRAIRQRTRRRRSRTRSSAAVLHLRRFIPVEQIPEGVRKVADVFPVKPLYDAFLLAFDPATRGSGIDWESLAVVAAWGVAGALVAIRTFRWSPRSQ